jgi:hypothetical protein
MAPGKNTRRKKNSAAAKAKNPKSAKPKYQRASRRSADPNSPGMRLRRFIEQTLREDPRLTLPGLLEATNAWARQGHTHLGYKLWTGERPFGPHYLGRLLQEAWAAKLASDELRRQARFFRENPDKDLDDLARDTRARLEALRARDAAKRERQARERAAKEERRKKAQAEREQKKRAERERRKRERKEGEQRAAEQARKRHAAALQHIVEFFAAAGINATTDGTSARVAGTVVTPSKAQVASRAKLDELIDRLVWTHHRDALLQSISRHLNHELRAVPGTNGWVLSDTRTPMVVIRATSAKAQSLPARSANYLTDGAHWRHLAEEIKTLRARDVRAEPRTRLRVFTELPPSLPAPIRDLALEASQQLRTERNLVFGHPVELQYADGTIRFDPLRQGSPHVELPVGWSRWSEDATAEVRIGGGRDPLHLSFRGEDDDSDVVHGWVLALVGYAQIVCREDLMDVLRPHPRSVTPAGPSSTRSPTPRTVAAPGRSPSMPGLKPIGRTARWISSYVAGHRRQLRPGHHASREARARAARVGIALRPGETWVSPHVRGVPPDAVLRFVWEAPAELQLAPA